MIMLVQRPRGPMGWHEKYRHLPWPSDVTNAQKNAWYEQYYGVRLKTKAVEVIYVESSRRPPPPPCPPPPGLHTRMVMEGTPLFKGSGWCKKCSSTTLSKTWFGPLFCIHSECSLHETPQ